MQSHKEKLAGLDAGRVLALILVIIQHVLTLLDRESATLILGLSLGQLGVALFLSISGYLAADNRRSPLSWLWQRLVRIYPAFWIALAFSFILAALSGIKTFDAYQVIAQFSGFGLFSHWSTLINTPTWFVSLLLVCYLGTWLIRLLKAPFILGLCFVAVLIFLVGTEPRPWLVSHLLTYAISSTFAWAGSVNRRRLNLLGCAFLTVLMIFVQVEFGYTLFALMVMEVALSLRRIPNIVALIAKYSYEFYLIHGVLLYGFIRCMPFSQIPAVILALVLSAIGAYLLHQLVFYCSARPRNTR